MASAQVGSPKLFDANDRRFWCGCHVKTGTITAAVIYTIVSVIELVMFIAVYRSPYWNGEINYPIIIWIFKLVAAFLSIGILFCGLATKRETLLLPFIVYMVIQTSLLIWGAVELLKFAYSPYRYYGYYYSYKRSSELHMAVGFRMFIIALLVLLHVWIIRTVKNTHSYIKWKRLSNNISSTTIPQNAAKHAYNPVPTKDDPPPSYQKVPYMEIAAENV